MTANGLILGRDETIQALGKALSAAEAERDAAVAVIARVAAVIAKLAEHIDNPEDISEYWREAFDATDDIEDILAEAAK